eukprot:gene5004-6989_t
MATEVKVYKSVDSQEEGLELGSVAEPTSNRNNDVKWSNVNYKVGDKSILTNCWGKVPSGKLCAIMGPSGAGKSSLLNVLAGRSSSTSTTFIDGLITVGGKEINPVAFRKNIAYVMQDDALLPTATPREALKFSATMRLPGTVTSEKINQLVENLLDELGLMVCADVLIGGALIKGISGGQRKRTSVGVEIITDPKLLFLDEPTSGLDSYSAHNCVQLLKKVASRNCAILCTIHQPSSEVFFLFDIVIYLKDGRIFYQGSVDDIVGYYGRLGHPCPENYNPSDFVMSLCQADSAEVLESKGLFVTIPQEFSEVSDRSRKFDESSVIVAAEKSYPRQLLALTHREFVAAYRDTQALIGRFGVTIVLGLLFGLIFLGRADRSNVNSEDFNTHVGAVSMVMILALFGSAQSILLSFPFERPMFLREYSTGTYDASAYFIAKLIVEIPMTFVQFIVLFLFCFYMIGWQGDYILIVLSAFGLGMASNSVACFLGCSVVDVKDVTELAPLLFVPQLLFAGFFIRTSQIPVFLRWAQYLCGFKYGMNLVLLNEFKASSARCQGAAAENCRSVIHSNNIDPENYWIYIILLFALFLVFRVLGFYILKAKATKFY